LLKKSKGQQSILCQFKTNSIKTPKEKHKKMKIYKTTIRRVVTYSSKTSTLTAKDDDNLRIFFIYFLRKIFGPVNINNVWRIRNSMDIDNLTEGADIVRFIKAQRIK
jgi:hypothetical protein